MRHDGRTDWTMCPVCCLQPSDDVAVLVPTHSPSVRTHLPLIPASMSWLHFSNLSSFASQKRLSPMQNVVCFNKSDTDIIYIMFVFLMEGIITFAGFINLSNLYQKCKEMF